MYRYIYICISSTTTTGTFLTLTLSKIRLPTTKMSSAFSLLSLSSAWAKRSSQEVVKNWVASSAKNIAKTFVCIMTLSPQPFVWWSVKTASNTINSVAPILRSIQIYPTFSAQKTSGSSSSSTKPVKMMQWKNVDWDSWWDNCSWDSWWIPIRF